MGPGFRLLHYKPKIGPSSTDDGIPDLGGSTRFLRSGLKLKTNLMMTLILESKALSVLAITIGRTVLEIKIKLDRFTSPKKLSSDCVSFVVLWIFFHDSSIDP